MNIVARCLIELQVINDALQLQHSAQTGHLSHIMQQQQQNRGVIGELPASWRLQIVDELCKPIAERVHFHFLQEQTGIMSDDVPQTPTRGNTGDNNTAQQLHQQQQASKLDKLPEWLFRYLRETIDNHGVFALVMEGVQPLVDSVVDSLIVRASLLAHDDVDGELNDNGDYDMVTEATTTLSELLQHLKNQYYIHSATYFLREVSRMGRHALRAKSFFHHPDVVGSECQDRTIVLRGIEQLFLFDSFINEKLKEEGEGDVGGICGGILAPPRMVDTFLSSNESLLQWWLDEERHGIIATLHECASTTISSYQSQNDEDHIFASHEVKSVDNINTSDRPQQLYPPISELFVALLHSARCKSNMFTSEHSHQMYIANVIAPLCSEYLDMVHAEAAYLRKKLLARPPTSSSSTTVPSVSVLRSANLPSNELLTSNTNKWAALITGTHLAAQVVLLHSSNNIQRQQHQITEEQPPPGVLDRVGESMERLCTAMVEEYTSAIVETIIMERAKLASYMMRAPFLLSEPPPDSPGRRGKRDHDMSIGSRMLSLSPDLNDSIHVVSVCIKGCNVTMAKIKSVFQSSDDNEEAGINKEGLKGVASIEPSTLLYHGCYSIHEALKFAIGQKLLDIAIDPQGMTPEIYLGGALQFKHDVMTFDRIFHLGSNGGSEERRGRTDINNNNVAGPMERVRTASHLMSLESSQIQAMRDTFHSLVTPNASIGSLFGRTADESAGEFNVGSRNRLNVDDFYKDQRLMEEAISMLEAKGFGALALDEALSILNRRC